jgi:hypothetical protein
VNRKVTLELKSQNIFEMFQYQLENMLDDLNKEKVTKETKKEEV